MDDVPPIINIAISLRIQPNEGPVFFKVDGTPVRPEPDHQAADGLQVQDRGGDEAGDRRGHQHEHRRHRLPPGAAVQGPGLGGLSRPVRHRGVPHTKSGDRQPVQVSMEFNKAGTFETVWQAKYYNYYKRSTASSATSSAASSMNANPTRPGP
ncbi:hypothetical protein INR49_009311 [Caranx melampygus]|nr:hypothetical protein INR49_009311 [Caranx melampygus]